MRKQKKQVAILGGAFDPITVGHVKLAQFVLNNVSGLNEVCLTPCYGHVYDKKMISANHRLQMVRLGILNIPEITVCDIEIKDKLPGDTYSLIKRLREVETNYNFSVIIGQDNANTIHLWVENEWLKNNVRVIVVPRKGIERIKTDNWYLQPPHLFLNKKTNIPEISSTQIRNLLKKDRTIRPEELDEKVYQYILANNLYGANQ